MTFKKKALPDSGKPFGTIIVDPPWPYHEVIGRKSRGYAIEQYKPVSLADLKGLPIGRIADYVFLWTTSVFSAEGSAADVVKRWGLVPITQIYWMKGTKFQETDSDAFRFKPAYSVGYWFRGCVEPIIVCKQPKARSIRTPWLGLISPTAGHSRKPDSLHELIEQYFPAPYGELFGRRERDGWNVLGDESPTDGRDIRESLSRLCRRYKIAEGSEGEEIDVC